MAHIGPMVIAGRTVFLWSSLVAHDMLVIIAGGTYCAYGHHWWDKEFPWSLLLARNMPAVIAGGAYCNYCHFNGLSCQFL